MKSSWRKTRRAIPWNSMISTSLGRCSSGGAEIAGRTASLCRKASSSQAKPTPSGCRRLHASRLSVNRFMHRLAVEGGRPVRTTLLPYGYQCIDDDDVRAVTETLQSSWLTTGPKVEEFERAFASAVGAKHAVAVSSGTAALHAATFAARIGPADDVITTPMTFAATANCVRYQGGTVVFADVRK